MYMMMMMGVLKKREGEGEERGKPLVQPALYSVTGNNREKFSDISVANCALVLNLAMQEVER